MRYLFFILSLLLIVSCNSTREINDGETAFQLKMYDKSYILLSKEYNESSNDETKARKAFLTAESLRRKGDYINALSWYNNAIELDYGEDAEFYRAYMFKSLEQYEKSLQAFTALSREYPNVRRYKQEIVSIKNAITWKNDDSVKSAIVKNLSLNSPENDFHPQWINDEEFTFVSDRLSSKGEGIYSWTGNKQADLFVYNLRTQDTRKYESGHNTDDFDGTITSDETGKIKIFTRCSALSDQENTYCRLYELSKFGLYRDAKLLDFIELNYNYMHPSLSRDGKTLIFSAELPGGVGNYDLWMSERSDNGEWSEPEVLSSRINSPGDERFPYQDGDTLYFSSNYVNGMGGLDIYLSYKMMDGSWSPPENLKSPINGGYDDFAYVPYHQLEKQENLKRAGFFSSNRPKGKGGDDIYLVKIPYKEESQEQENEKPDYIVMLDFYTYSRDSIDIAKRNLLSDATVKINSANLDTVLSSGDKGFISLEVNSDENYEIVVSAPGFLSKPANYSGKQFTRIGNRKKTVYVKSITLDPVIKNKEIVLDDIYYDYDEYYIREDAQPTLDTLAQMLQYNPNIRIQLGSHTDCRGDEEYNQILAQNRADAAVAYLQSKGIAASRLESKGYGESMPIADCACETCTEEEHQLNRRTTFLILE